MHRTFIDLPTNLVEKVRNLRRCPPKIEKTFLPDKQILTLNGTVGSSDMRFDDVREVMPCRRRAPDAGGILDNVKERGEYRQRDAKKEARQRKAESNTRTDEDHNPNCSYHGPDDRRGTQWVCCTDR